MATPALLHSVTTSQNEMEPLLFSWEENKNQTNPQINQRESIKQYNLSL